MNVQEKANALRERADFLFDAWVRGMCDEPEVDAAWRAAKAAEAELAKETP
jgi:hypothetical protein